MDAIYIHSCIHRGFERMNPSLGETDSHREPAVQRFLPEER